MRKTVFILVLLFVVACGAATEPTPDRPHSPTDAAPLPSVGATRSIEAEISPTPVLSLAPTTTQIPPSPTKVPPTSTRVPPTATLKPPPATPQTGAPLPERALLNLTHEYQKWNNCGPVSLGVVATYYGIPRNQFQAAEAVKGAELDKNVGVTEMSGYLQGLGLKTIVRVNGSAPLMMRLAASGFPVIVHQWLQKPDGELVGHYRVVQGYDLGAGMIITSDPYTPPKMAFSLADFERFWQPWNHLYIIAYRADQEAALKAIMGEDFDAAANIAKGIQMEQARTAANPRDPYEFFSLGDDRLAASDVSGALAAYDQARALGLPAHFAWYNFGPYEALYRAGAYQQMLDLSTPVLKDANNLEEIHFWRGKALLGLGQKDKAKSEFAIAVQLNAHYGEAKVALAALS